jgi:hypothetical protein
MGLSEWEKRDAAMWDGFRNGNSSFSPSVADNNNSTTKITTVTEDANGNKQTVVNENKTAADLMKQKQQEAYDREEPGRQAHAKQVAQRAFDSKMLFDPSIKGTPAWMEYGDTTFGPQAQIPAQYTNIDLPNKDVVNAQGLSRGNIFDRINDGIMSGNLDKAEADRIRMEKGPTSASAISQAEIDKQVMEENAFMNKLELPTLDLPGTSIGDQIRANQSKERGTDMASEQKVYDADQAEKAGVISKQQADKIRAEAEIAIAKEDADRALVAKQHADNRAAKKAAEEAAEAKKAYNIAVDDAVTGGLITAEQGKAKKDGYTPESIFDKGSLDGDAPITTEVEAKAVIDSPENIAAKAELNKWLESIKDPVVTKEQAKASAEAMINNAVAAAPKNDGSKLKKALILAAGSMLFGSSFIEALNAGFGVVGKEVEKEQKITAELAKEQREIDKAIKIHAGKKAIDGITGPKFTAKPQYVNIGTLSKPVRATLTQAENGSLYIKHGNNKPVVVTTQQYSDWYSPKEQSESFRKNADIVKKQVVGSLKETIGDKDNKEWNQTYSTALEAANQVSGALNAYKEAGINVETGMSSYTQEALESSVLAYAMYKHKNPGGKKALKEFAQDSIIRSNMSESIVQKDGSYLQLPDRAWVLPAPGAVDYKVGEMPDKAYAEAQSGLNSYIHAQSKKLNTKALFDMSNAQKFLIAYQAFETIKDKQPDQAAIEAGYTPFMWWLKQQRK